MHAYDPGEHPSASEWLELTELRRIELIEAFHVNQGTDLPSLRAHAAIHCAVENQIAENFEPTVQAIARLCAEGLSRHDAIHAVGSVVAEHIFEVLKAPGPGNPGMMNEQMAKDIDCISAKRWREKYE
jgi:hypothetical protein